MNRRDFALTGAMAVVTSGLRSGEVRAQTRANGTDPTPPPDDTIRAVFHFADPSREVNLRGLHNARNGLRAAGAHPLAIVLVIHGPALGWFRRTEPTHLGEPLAELLATGHVTWRACRITMEEHHWREEDLLPGATVVPSGTWEVLQRQHAGHVYFKPS